MKKTFVIFCAAIILGIIAMIAMNSYIKGEDKIECAVIDEKGNSSLIEDFKLHTVRYNDYWNDSKTNWDAITTFKDGISTKTEKFFEKKDYSIIRALYEDIRCLEWFDYTVRYIYEKTAIDDLYYLHNETYDIYDEAGKNPVKIDENTKCILGDGCIFVWNKNILYKLNDTFDPATRKLTYSIVGEYEYTPHQAELSDDNSVITAVIEKEDGQYISFIDAKTGQVISEQYACELNDDVKDFDFKFYDKTDYIYVLVSRYIQIEMEEEAVEDYGCDYKVMVFDRKATYNMCDEFIDYPQMDLIGFIEAYAYDSNNRRLAVLKNFKYYWNTSRNIVIEVFENGTRDYYYGEYDFNLKKWHEYDDLDDQYNDIGELVLDIYY